MRALLIVSALLVSEASAQDLCGAVLNKAVFNTATTSSVVDFANRFKHAMCDEEWASQTDAMSRAQEFGFDVEILGIPFGGSSSDAASSQSISEAYRLYCSQTIEEIAFSSSFYHRYSSSDVAVDAWSKCVQNAEGHFALVKPDPTLTGAVINLTKRTTGRLETLSIASIEVSPPKAVECHFGGALASVAKFPEGASVISISCQKRPDTPAEFTINSNWGVFGPISLRGFSQELQKLHLEIARLDQRIRTLEATKYVLASQLSEQADNLGFVRFDVPITIRAENNPGVRIARHGGGGNYLSPYFLEEGDPRLGPLGTTTWRLKRE